MGYRGIAPNGKSNQCPCWSFYALVGLVSLQCFKVTKFRIQVRSCCLSEIDKNNSDSCSAKNQQNKLGNIFDDSSMIEPDSASAAALSMISDDEEFKYRDYLQDNRPKRLLSDYPLNETAECDETMLAEFDVPDDDEMETNFTAAQRQLITNKSKISVKSKHMDDPRFR